MIHVRVDDEPENSKAAFACGLLGKLPPGDVYYFQSEARQASFRSEEVCLGCYQDGKPEIGTPLSELSGRPEHPGYDEFKRIAESWGYP